MVTLVRHRFYNHQETPKNMTGAMSIAPVIIKGISNEKNDPYFINCCLA
jgi:hypothetical protein